MYVQIVNKSGYRYCIRVYAPYTYVCTHQPNHVSQRQSPHTYIHTYIHTRIHTHIHTHTGVQLTAEGQVYVCVPRSWDIPTNPRFSVPDFASMNHASSMAPHRALGVPVSVDANGVMYCGWLPAGLNPTGVYAVHRTPDMKPFVTWLGVRVRSKMKISSLASRKDFTPSRQAAFLASILAGLVSAGASALRVSMCLYCVCVCVCVCVYACVFSPGW